MDVSSPNPSRVSQREALFVSGLAACLWRQTLDLAG